MLTWPLVMSIQHDIPTGTCYSCRDTFELPGYNRDCCSESCWYKHKGEKAIHILENDHRFCPTCGSMLKEVSPPSDDWKYTNGNTTQVALDNGGTLSKENGMQFLDLTEVRDIRPVAVDSVIGFEYRTPNAINVEREFPGAHKYSRIIGKGIGCKCGNTDPNTKIEELQEVNQAQVLANYVKTFRVLEREGQLDQRIDKTLFFDSYKESNGDIEYALGKALFD